jgi:glycosyltransferase involved in cell wall biosynthesis
LPVGARLDRAVIMPTLILEAVALMRRADVVHLHLPLAEAAILVAIARAMGKRVIVTQHADLVLEGSPLTRLAANAAKWSAIVAARLAHAVVANTAARAALSPVTRNTGDRLRVIPPPIVVAQVAGGAADAFRRDWNLGPGPIVGYVGRFASEKGVEVLLQAIPTLLGHFPNLTVALAGPQHDPRTGEPLRGPWDTWLARHAPSIRKVGELGDEDLARFYAACDVLVLPSIDWTESFGMVQVEAMLQGTPVVASNLPGVADPVKRTGAGRLAEPGDIAGLANAITSVLRDPERYRPDPDAVARLYSLEATVDAYERVYNNVDDARDQPA